MRIFELFKFGNFINFFDSTGILKWVCYDIVVYVIRFSSKQYIQVHISRANTFRNRSKRAESYNMCTEYVEVYNILSFSNNCNTHSNYTTTL